ncbi:hypothetical protein B0T25DRAFT_151711 [Lasiosphaeria hispida]|uniref:Uncharacterized protein n=1 Tax=Lasiosphaeria hispida TaxID=260671 RepID=A0AAJ0MG09_9PEZI|nr:hypothetical protein B0T25DRAFT_151711 [Lasiosphaeria hispida]
MANQPRISGPGEEGYAMSATGNANGPPQAARFEDELPGAPMNDETEQSGGEEQESFFTQEWLEPIAHFFGFPTPWAAKPAQRYGDNYPYRLNPSKRRTPISQKCDAELTEDGKRLVPLKVQATASLRRLENSTWQRHYIRDTSTTLLQLSKMPGRSRETAAQKWGIPASWLVFALNWILALSSLCAWAAFLLLRAIKRLCVPHRAPFEPPTYLSFYYDNPRYARVAASAGDNRKAGDRNVPASRLGLSADASYRRPKPRMLMQRNHDRAVELVIDPPADAQYVFIAFTFSQFPGREGEVPNSEMIELTRVANTMTGSLGYDYFWCCMSCHSEDGTVTDLLEAMDRGVYEISDVIRGAERVIIVLPAPDRPAPTPPLRGLVVLNQPASGSEIAAMMPSLREWGARIWTFPEVVLGPDRPIKVCWKEGNHIRWCEWTKQEFPALVWDDTETSRQLIEHYGTTNLSRLEFVKIALECLMHRARQGNLQCHYRGDISYVLMGFLRLRPIINRHDSSLQAFARLSLPADSDRLMERFVCLQPPSRDSPWMRMDDAYHASLWNIEPSIQISGVGENDTLIIEKA